MNLSRALVLGPEEGREAGTDEHVGPRGRWRELGRAMHASLLASVFGLEWEAGPSAKHEGWELAVRLWRGGS